MPRKRRTAKSASSQATSTVRATLFTPEFLEDLRWGADTNRSTALRVLDLVDAVTRDPFTGIGKPEPLKELGSNLWSRRVTEEHRLVYHVADDRISFLQCRYHY